MNYYVLYATETCREASELAKELNRVSAVANIALVARQKSGNLKKPYRYFVLTTSETLRNNSDLLRIVRASVNPPRLPWFRLAREWFFNVLINSIEALTRWIRKLKGARA